MWVGRKVEGDDRTGDERRLGSSISIRAAAVAEADRATAPRRRTRRLRATTESTTTATETWTWRTRTAAVACARMPSWVIPAPTTATAARTSAGDGADARYVSENRVRRGVGASSWQNKRAARSRFVRRRHQREPRLVRLSRGTALTEFTASRDRLEREGGLGRRDFVVRSRCSELLWWNRTQGPPTRGKRAPRFDSHVLARITPVM